MQHGSKYCSRRHTLDFGVGSKGQDIFFLKSIMLDIIILGMECIAH